jgi:hypothetical protein
MPGAPTHLSIEVLVVILQSVVQRPGVLQDAALGGKPAEHAYVHRGFVVLLDLDVSVGGLGGLLLRAGAGSRSRKHCQVWCKLWDPKRWLEGFPPSAAQRGTEQNSAAQSSAVQRSAACLTWYSSGIQ